MSSPFISVFVLFPGVTQLDFTGPLEVLSRLPQSQVVLASEHGGELDLGAGLQLTGLATLRDVPTCSLVCITGGYGILAALRSSVLLAEISRLGAASRYVASVCNGSLLLAAVGLLAGKRAACHWAWRELLSEFDVAPDAARVVRDGNVFTGGGVTAGIDMALTVAAEIAGRDFAEALQLALEYAPEPPFNVGRPELARPEILRAVRQRLEARAGDRLETIQAIAAAGRATRFTGPRAAGE